MAMKTRVTRLGGRVVGNKQNTAFIVIALLCLSLALFIYRPGKNRNAAAPFDFLHVFHPSVAEPDFHFALTDSEISLIKKGNAHLKTELLSFTCKPDIIRQSLLTHLSPDDGWTAKVEGTIVTFGKEKPKLTCMFGLGPPVSVQSDPPKYVTCYVVTFSRSD